LIFALVFGILSRMGLFKENKAVTAIIALAVGLMALSVPTVPQFFSQIFPSMGIGLSILLVIMIIVGLFSDPNKPWLTISLFVVAAIVALVVIVQSSGIDLGSWIQNNLGNTAGTLVIVAVVIVVIAVIIGRGRKGTEHTPVGFAPLWARDAPPK
jgi:peptidoglycan/LPS O-acetylase OafA/YrhL